jgi:hypothetical protein
MTDSPKQLLSPARQLIGLTSLLVAMYLYMQAFRFTNDWLNLAFEGLFLFVPFLAIPAVLRLRSRAKAWAIVLLVPVVAISAIRLFFFAIGDVPATLEHRELSHELGIVQQGGYSVQLEWEETAGGALGPHGVLLEQRRVLLPGLYAWRSLDYFEGASQGSVSPAGPNRIELHIPSNPRSNGIDRDYVLKPWLYF